MTTNEKSSYKQRLQSMLEYSSIQKMRDYFEAKAGDLEYFSEENFLYFVKAVMSLVRFMEQPDPDSALQDLDEEVLNRYLKHLREKGNATATQRLRISHVKRWVRSNGVKLEWDKVIVPRVRSVVNDRAPTKTELRKIMNYAPKWIIPVTLILASSGMRIGSLILLRLKHLNLDSFSDLGIIEIPPTAAKGGIGYFTAITLEAREALEKHLAQRAEKGEILGPESPLIKAPMTKGNTSYPSVSQAWNRCLNSAGLNEKSRGTYVLHLHTLRKFFRSQVEGSLTKSIRESLMGHSTVEYLDKNYLRIPEQEMAEWYRKAVPALTVLADVQSEDFQRKMLLIQAEQLLKPDELLQLKEIMATEYNIDIVIEELRRLTSQPNNETYKIVSGEDELLGLLSKGYKLEKELNGDKYLVIHG